MREFETFCDPDTLYVSGQLRDIEIIVQQQMEESGKEDEVLKEIQKILYSTEVCGIVFNGAIYAHTTTTGGI